MSNKQTTAVSQLIEKLKELRDFYPPNGNAMIRRVRGTYTNAIIEAQKQLPIERKQIEDVSKGLENCIRYHLTEHERNADFSIGTEALRCIIDDYKEKYFTSTFIED